MNSRSEGGGSDEDWAVIRDLLSGNPERERDAGDKLALLIIRCLRMQRYPPEHQDHSELLNRIWTKLVESWRRNREAALSIKNVPGYVWTTTAREIASLKRGENTDRRRAGGEPKDDLEPQLIDPVDPITIRDKFRKLSEECQRVLWLGIVEDRTVEEAAGCLGVSSSTFKRRRGECLETLRRTCGGEG